MNDIFVFCTNMTLVNKHTTI